MSTLNRLVAFVMLLIFSCSASATVIEGTFSGQMWEWYGSNMEVTPDAEFWKDENAYSVLSGTFWYDTELAGPPITKENFAGVVSDTYSGSHNWLHTLLIGKNGESIDITTSGVLGSFSQQPMETMIIDKYDDGVESSSQLSTYYRDVEGASRRNGYFSLESADLVFDNLGFERSFSLQSNEFNNPIGYISFENIGLLDGIEYSSFVFGEINHADIHVKVPEPSSLFLFIGPLLFLLWRVGLLVGFSRVFNCKFQS